MTEYSRIRVRRVDEPKIRVRVKPRVPPLEIELQNTGTEIQWRLGTTGDWQTLVEIDDIDASVTIGTVTTLAAGQPATVTNVGTAQNVVLNFGIPAGEDGTDGADGLLASVVAGTNITVDNTDPANPIINAAGGISDGDKGDITVSGGGATLTIDNGVVTTTKMGGDVTTPGKALLTAADVPAQRTALGVGTGDSPEFNAVNIGNASDTTVARGAAGFLAVEGKAVPSPASQVAGDTLYRGASQWERIAKGTAAQINRMNAGATAPEWWTAAWTVADMAASAVVTEAEGISSNDNDTSFPTSAAVKDYVDNNGGSTVNDTQQPTTDQSEVATTGLSGCRKVEASFAFTFNGSSGATCIVQARTSGGTWREVFTFTTNASSPPTSFAGCVSIFNFNQASEKGYRGEVGRASGALDSSTANNSYTVVTETVGMMAYDEVWDEIRLLAPGTDLEGDTVDRRGRWTVIGTP